MHTNNSLCYPTQLQSLGYATLENHLCAEVKKIPFITVCQSFGLSEREIRSLMQNSANKLLIDEGFHDTAMETFDYYANGDVRYFQAICKNNMVTLQDSKPPPRFDSNPINVKQIAGVEKLNNNIQYTFEGITELFRTISNHQKQLNSTNTLNPVKNMAIRGNTPTSSSSKQLNEIRPKDPYLIEINKAIFGDSSQSIPKTHPAFNQAAEDYALFGMHYTDAVDLFKRQQMGNQIKANLLKQVNARAQYWGRQQMANNHFRAACMKLYQMQKSGNTFQVQPYLPIQKQTLDAFTPSMIQQLNAANALLRAKTEVPHYELPSSSDNKS